MYSDVQKNSDVRTNIPCAHACKGETLENKPIHVFCNQHKTKTGATILREFSSQSDTVLVKSPLPNHFTQGVIHYQVWEFLTFQNIAVLNALMLQVVL